MATNLAKAPPVFDGKNVAGYLSQVDNYLSYLYETMDFLLGQMQRKIESAEKQNQALIKRVGELEAAAVTPAPET